jgi:hypothetical protein
MGIFSKKIALQEDAQLDKVSPILSDAPCDEERVVNREPVHFLDAVVRLRRVVTFRVRKFP